MLNIETVVCGALEENAYIVSKKGEAGAFLIDPGDDYASLVRALAGRSLEAICLTHAHYDHMLSAPGLIADTGAKLYVSARDIPALNDARLNLYNPAWSRLPAPQGAEGPCLRRNAGGLRRTTGDPSHAGAYAGRRLPLRQRRGRFVQRRHALLRRLRARGLPRLQRRGHARLASAALRAAWRNARFPRPRRGKRPSRGKGRATSYDHPRFYPGNGFYPGHGRRVAPVLRRRAHLLWRRRRG